MTWWDVLKALMLMSAFCIYEPAANEARRFKNFKLAVPLYAIAYYQLIMLLGVVRGVI